MMLSRFSALITMIVVQVVVMEGEHAGTRTWDLVQAAEMIAHDIPPVFVSQGEAASKGLPQVRFPNSFHYFRHVQY